MPGTLNDEKLRSLYDKASTIANWGDYNSFATKMQDPAKRKSFFDKASTLANFGTYDDFEKKLTNPSQPQSPAQAPVQPVQNQQVNMPAQVSPIDQLLADKKAMGNTILPENTQKLYGSPEFRTTAKENAIQAKHEEDLAKLDNGVSRPMSSIATFNQAVYNAPADILELLGAGANQVGRITEAMGLEDRTKTEDQWLYKLGQSYRKKINEITPDNPAYREELQTQVSSSLGQLVPLVLSGGSAAAKSIPSITNEIAQFNRAGNLFATSIQEGKQLINTPPAILGAIQTGMAEFHQAKDAGADDDSAFSAFLKNAGAGGILESIPITHFFSRLDKTTGGGVKQLLKNGTTQGIDEMTTEIAQQVFANVDASGTYDKTRKWYEGMTESGGIGFGLGFVLGGMGTSLRQKKSEAPTPKEQEEIQKAIDFVDQKSNELANKEGKVDNKEANLSTKVEENTLPAQEPVTEKKQRQISAAEEMARRAAMSTENTPSQIAEQATIEESPAITEATTDQPIEPEPVTADEAPQEATPIESAIQEYQLPEETTPIEEVKPVKKPLQKAIEVKKPEVVQKSVVESKPVEKPKPTPKPDNTQSVIDDMKNTLSKKEVTHEDIARIKTNLDDLTPKQYDTIVDKHGDLFDKYENHKEQLKRNKNATQIREIEQSNISEHKGAGENGKTAKTSNSNSNEQGGKVKEEEIDPAKATLEQIANEFKEGHPNRELINTIAEAKTKLKKSKLYGKSPVEIKKGIDSGEITTDDINEIAQVRKSLNKADLKAAHNQFNTYHGIKVANTVSDLRKELDTIKVNKSKGTKEFASLSKDRESVLEKRQDIHDIHSEINDLKNDRKNMPEKEYIEKYKELGSKLDQAIEDYATAKNELIGLKGIRQAGEKGKIERGNVSITGKKITNAEKRSLKKENEEISREDAIEQEMKKVASNTTKNNKEEPKKAKHQKVVKMDEGSQPESYKQDLYNFRRAREASKQVSQAEFVNNIGGDINLKNALNSLLNAANAIRKDAGEHDADYFIHPENKVPYGKSHTYGVYHENLGQFIVGSKSEERDAAHGYNTLASTYIHEAIHQVALLTERYGKDYLLKSNKIDPKTKKAIEVTSVFAKDVQKQFDYTKTYIEKVIDGEVKNSGLDRALRDYVDHLSTVNGKEKGLPITKDGVNKGVYGLTNMDEMIAEAFTNPYFTNILLNVPVDSSSRINSKWESVGKSNSTLGYLLKRTIQLITELKTIAHISPTVIANKFEGSILRNLFELTQLHTDAIVDGIDMIVDSYTPNLSVNKTAVRKDYSALKQEAENKSASPLNPTRPEVVKALDKMISELPPGVPVRMIKKMVDNINNDLPPNNKITKSEMIEAVRNRNEAVKATLKSKAGIVSQINKLKYKLFKAKSEAEARNEIIKQIKDNLKKTNIYNFDSKEVNMMLNMIKNAKTIGSLSMVLDKFKVFLDNKQLLNRYDAIHKLQSKLKVGVSIDEAYRNTDIPKFIKIDPATMSEDMFDDYERIMGDIKSGLPILKEVNDFMDQYKKEFSKYAQEDIENEPLTDEEIKILDEKAAKLKEKRIKNNEQTIEDLTTAINQIKNLNKGGFKFGDSSISPKLKQMANDLLNVDINLFKSNKVNKDGELEPNLNKEKKELLKYYQALLGLEQNHVFTSDAGQIVIKDKAEKSIRSFLDNTKEGDFDVLNATLSKLKSTDAIIRHMSKWSNDVAGKLSGLAYSHISRNDSFVQDQHGSIMKEMSNIIDKNKLDVHNFLRIKAIADLNDIVDGESIEDNIKKYSKAIENKLSAKGNPNNEIKFSEENIKEERDVLNDAIKYYNKNKSLDGFLSKGENELLNAMYGTINEIAPDTEFNTVSVHGSQFKKRPTYFPTIALGRNYGDFKYGGDDTIKALTKFEGEGKNIPAYESSHSKSRDKNLANGTYYDNNAMSVFDKFLSRQLYDNNMSQELYRLNIVLNDKRVEERLGAKNIETIKKSLGTMVKSGRGRFINYSPMVKAIEKVKNNYIISTLGHTMQFANQFIATLPNMAIQFGPINTAKAIADAIRLDDNLYKQKSNTLYVRNYLNDRYNPESTHRDERKKAFGIPHKARVAKEAVENVTTKMLRGTDMFAAKVSFLASLHQQGADINNPTQEQIDIADNMASSVQGVSNKNAQAPFFQPGALGKSGRNDAMMNNIHRVMLSTMFAYKSFNMGQMLNTYNAFWHLKSAEARKAVLGNLAGSAAFYFISNFIYNSVWPAAAGMVSDLLGQGLKQNPGEGDEEEEENKNPDVENQRAIAQIVTDYVMGGYPEQAQKWIEALAEDVHKKQFNYDAETKEAQTGEEQPKYNKFRDAIFPQGRGGITDYTGAYKPMFKGIENATDALLKTANEKEIPKSQQLDMIADALVVTGIMNFGDVIKVLRTQSRIAKSQERYEKKHEDENK